MSRRSVNVLLVDDDDVDRMAVERAFRKLDPNEVVLHCLHDADAALDLLKSTELPRPRLVLLDLNMPRMSGHELLAELRSDPVTQRDVVFVLSTSADPADVEQAYGANVAGYLVKERLGQGMHGLIDVLRPYWEHIALEQQ